MMVRSTTRLAGSAGEVLISVGLPAVLIGAAITPGVVPARVNAPQMDVDGVCRGAVEQVRAGATVVEVKVACLPDDKGAVLPDVIAVVGSAVTVPLCISAQDPEALDAALAVCPGKPVALLSNVPAPLRSQALAAARRHGAAVIVPTAVGDERLVSLEERIELARAQLRESILAGIPRNDVILDLASLPEAKYPGATALLLRLAAHLSQVDTINLSLRVGAAADGMPSAELFTEILIARALAAGVTCVIADARSERLAVSLAESLMV